MGSGSPILRPWRDDDVEAFAALNADPAVMEHFPARLSRAETEAMVGRIRAHFEQHGFGIWAVEVPGVAPFIGTVGLMVPAHELPFTPCVEIGWRLARAYWGRGYATAAARSALAIGFGELGLTEIVSFTTVGNRRSRALMERLGMARDADDDFEHPVFPPGHPLRPHVLYRLRRP